MAASQFVNSRLFKSLPYNSSLSKENRCRIYPCDPKELSFFCDNDHFYTQKSILKRLQTLKCHCNRHTRTHRPSAIPLVRSLARVPIDLQAGWSDRTSVCPAVVQPYRPGGGLAAWCQRDFFGSRKGRSTTTLPNASLGGRSVVIGFVYSPRIPDKPPPPDIIPPTVRISSFLTHIHGESWHDNLCRDFYRIHFFNDKIRPRIHF